ncbi:MAG TPA: hypothetical protein PL110_18155 [Candidatus Eremiobacteraeota bacterium]|nr:hypothetical protein [Candidatus Eremiobacteraeota bacterium]
MEILKTKSEVIQLINELAEQELLAIKKIIQSNLLSYLSPFYIKEFILDNKRYILKDPVICNVDYQDDLWIYEVPRYGLHAFSKDRKEAFFQLQDEFVFLCDTFLHEEDEKLTQDAIALRDIIRKDLLKIEGIDNE